jgi:hypothetical protein
MPAELDAKARVAAMLLERGGHEPALRKGSPPAQRSRGGDAAIEKTEVASGSWA